MGEAHLAFLRELSEAVDAAPDSLLIASLTMSKLEDLQVFTEDEAEFTLTKLEDILRRVEDSRTPIESTKIYDIVRTRLFQEVDETVASYYGLSEDDLRGARRTRRIARPHQVAMYLIREETDASFPQIGAELGDRDHTTILYGYERVRTRMEQNDELRRDVMTLKGQLYG